MTRNTFFTVMMTIAMMMASVNTYGRGHRAISNAPRGRYEMAHRAVNVRHNAPVHHVAHRPIVPNVDHRGFVPGWEGRVRFVDGRWGYLRAGRWMWYNTYFDPAYYFGHPVAEFHTHHVNPAGVVAGVATGVAVGALVSALCR